jgi:aminoglycoside phosphotransferase (APT) family kinase protein
MASAQWATSSGAPDSGEIVRHGDFGPWNLVWRDGLPIGILDWDNAWPVAGTARRRLCA